MPKQRDLLVHVKLDTASRKRKCHGFRCTKGIAGGEQVLAVRVQPAPAVWYSYCAIHAKPLLDSAISKVAVLKSGL